VAQLLTYEDVSISKIITALEEQQRRHQSQPSSQASAATAASSDDQLDAVVSTDSVPSANFTLVAVTEAVGKLKSVHPTVR